MPDLDAVPAGFAGLRELHRGQAVDEAPIFGLLAFIDARLDCADFRALTVCKLALDHGNQLSPATLAAITATLLNFKYWLDEPGVDSMCYWSENHQVIFATVEYLAGGQWPDEVFSNSGTTGLERRKQARRRLGRWLADRRRFGFSEWLSNTYYEEDIAALALLVDHAEPAIAEQATAVLDVAMYELAAHSVGGVLGASSGRCYERQKKFPASAEVRMIMAHAFGLGAGLEHGNADGLDWGGLSALFYTCSYRPPPRTLELAASTSTQLITTSHGVNVEELPTLLAHRDEEEAGAFAWAMEAFVSPETVRLSRTLLTRYGLQDNAFLRPLRMLERVPGPLLPPLVRLLRPVAAGMALHRADVTTWRSDFGTLSSAMRYRPGEFGDQQHLWQATLGEVGVFTTHPAGEPETPSVRNRTPSEWVGNGVNPDVAQNENLLVARYDTRGRRGWAEPRRRRRSHLYWPTARFDESLAGPHWLAARVGQGLIGLRAAGPLHPGAEDEYVQNGVITGWGVVVQRAEGGPKELTRFAARVADSTLFVDGFGLRWFSEWSGLELPAQGPFTVNGRAPNVHFSRTNELIEDGWVDR